MRVSLDDKSKFESRYGYRWWDRVYYPLLVLAILCAAILLVIGEGSRGIYLLAIGAVLASIMEYRRYKRRSYHESSK